MATPSPKNPLSEWVRRISEEEMPIFGHTVQQIVSIAEDDDTPAVELARVILQDASMTTRVLKLANSTYYNPRAQGISTVSRAVIVLGFNTVHNMCLSIALVDAFVQGAPRDRLNQELARSIHAAVQARAIALEADDDSPEEVFIATLLYHLGDMAFWCFSGKTGEELDTLMKQPGFTEEEAQDEVLGFRLRQLTEGLAREWHLNELLTTTLTQPQAAGKRAKTIVLSHRLAVAAECGWDAPQVKALTGELAKLNGGPEKAMQNLLHLNAREASRIAGYYGAATAARIIPVPFATGEDTADEAGAEAPAFPEPDGMLQLRILRELSMLLDQGGDFNMIMELVLEGIYRGIGMDRTLFALLTPDRRGLRAKFMLGGGDEGLTTRFNFTQHPQQPNIFFHVLERPAALWVDPATNPNQSAQLPPAVTGVIGRTPFLVAPIIVNKRCIGVFYADRALSGRALDEEGFESFKHFVQQANLGLTHIASLKH